MAEQFLILPGGGDASFLSLTKFSQTKLIFFPVAAAS